MSRYRIQAVAKLSGVPPATLRAWERRYGVPQPSRTAAAYRLYSDDDIALITKMRDLVKSGMAAAEAARTALAGAGSRPPDEAQEEADPFGAATDRIIDAVMRFDPEALDREVSRALNLGSAVALFDGTLGPALRRVGDLWHEGVITVAQEHLASNVIGATLLHLLRLIQPPDSARRAVLACFSDEDHTIGLYGVGLRFATWGFRTLLLGPRTPPSAVARVVDALAPDVVALSATIVPPSAIAREMIDAYADACRGCVWVVGGAAAGPMKPWIEARGGLCASDDQPDMRRLIETAIRAGRRRSRPPEGEPK